MIGILDYDLLGINLKKSELEPLVFPRPLNEIVLI